MTDADRFWRRVERSSGCWIWAGARYQNGYGAFAVSPVPKKVKHWRAHRFAWELANGPIPEGLRVLHHCDNPPCVKTEPDEQWPEGHLFLGTDLDNLRDAQSKGRRPTSARVRPGRVWGADHHSAKLTVVDVEAIRRRYSQLGETQTSLATEYGVTQTAISAVLTGRTWRKAPGPITRSWRRT